MTKKINKRKILKALAVTFSLTSFLFVVPTTLLAEENSSVMSEEEIQAKMEKLFQQAMEKREAGNMFSAIEDFQSILSNQPKLHRARLEMAVAFYQTYKFDQAVKEAQTVLDDPETPPNVRVAILAFMAQVKQDSEKLAGGQHTWKFPFEFGYTYDTNVNVGPGSIGGDAAIPGLKKLSDSGTIASVGIDHTYQTSKRYNWGATPTTLLWQSGVNIYNKNYINEDDYDLIVASFRTGPTFVTTGSWRANITLQEDILVWGGTKYGNFSYLLPSYTYHWGESGIETTADAVVAYYDYSRSSYQGRDSVYLAPRLSVGYTFYDGKMAVQTGLQYINENASESRWSQDAVNGFVTGSWKILEKTTVHAIYSQTEARYDAPPAPLVPGWDQSRDEIGRKYTFGITHTFSDFYCLTDWSINAEVTHTSMDSNVAAYDYSRTENLLTLSRRF